MSLIPIDQLIGALSEDQVLEKFLTDLEGLGIPARSWRVGGVSRTILRVVARTYAGFTDVMSFFIKSGFLEWASGGWLTLLAYYVYGVTRVPASFATVDLVLTNSGGGVYTYGIGEAQARNPTTKKVYTNTTAFTLNPGDVQTLSFVAVELGTASNSAPGTITELVTVMALVTVTNPAAAVGTDEEKDPDLRQRCRDKLSTLSSLGPRGAYAYAVKSALRLDGSPVDVNRVAVSPFSSTGVVDIYVASAAGAPSSGDLDAIRVSVEALARPDSVTANVNPVTTSALSRTLTVWAVRTDGVSADDILAAVNAALIVMASTYPIGGITKPPATQGYLYASTIDGTAKGAHPSIYAVDGVGGDLVLNPGEVPILSTTVTVRIVEAP